MDDTTQGVAVGHGGEGMAKQERPRCGEPTEAGTPCRLGPFPGGGGKCHRHARIPQSTSQREGARMNAAKHGAFATHYLDEEDPCARGAAGGASN